MTVGQELAKISGLKLLHNHMTIELVRQFFSIHESEEGARLNNLFRQEIFEAVAKSDLKGLIFTYMFVFGSDLEHKYINSLIELFKQNSANAHVVELCADYDVRIERNKTENHLEHKASKRDLEKSEQLFRTVEEKYRLNSNENEELGFEGYIKINNTNIKPEEVTLMIKNKFNL